MSGAQPVEGPYDVVLPGEAGHFGQANDTDPPRIEIHDVFGRTAIVQGDVDDPEVQATAKLLAASWTLHDALKSAARTIAVLKTFCTVPLTVVRAAETEHEIERAIAAAEGR